MRKFHLNLSGFTLFLLIIACNESEKIPNVYEVKAHFHQKTIPAEFTQTQILKFNTPPGMAVRKEKVSQVVSDIGVTVIRTEGNRIPPFSAFVSQTFFRRDIDLLRGFAGIAGNIE
ncbi:hypothetical protein [Pleomorphovibrio marinus]|uniref:hypothetical protein n=1 Tax=Pleomorphovibrio marinus TaxID=2164132 RepID=UPI000E0B885E|nr:hypothetical protein [Pleomorphovibrio marinus]